MIEKNQEVEVVIEGYNSEGQGIARVDGFVVFVPFALKGERVQVHIIKVTKSYAVGKVVKIIKASKDRVNAQCPVFGKCGGCTLQHTKNGLEIKKQIVKDALTKLGGFYDVDIPDVIASDKQYYYRNKSAFPLFIDDNGDLQLAMYKNLSHNPVYIDFCPISDPIINKSAEIFKNFVNTYDKNKSATGYKYLVQRVIAGKLLCAIVSDQKIKNANILYENLKIGLNLADEDLGVFWCKKSKDNNVILEGKLTKLCGIDSISCNVLGEDIEVSIMSFFQVNAFIMEQIYSKVLENISGDDTVIDAYSGAGLLSALIAKKAKQVYGVEIVKEATRDAEALKKCNNIQNLVNVNGDAGDIVPKLIKNLGDKVSVVLDPPRKGAEVRVLESIAGAMPKKIIYVSCNPASLARDLKLLAQRGYNIESVQPFDMFPQTAHVETVVVLKKAIM